MSRAGTGASPDLCRTVYPELVGEARAIARQHGYAVGVHGSLQYDLDLIAVPWITDCAKPCQLATALARGMSRCLGIDDPLIKPHGRTAYTMMFHDRLHVDLSIVRAETFQASVKPWLHTCFGPDVAADKLHRNQRFLEEALELVQANGCTQSEAHQLVDYVFGRPQGEINQEVGGVMLTLAALCIAAGLDMHSAGETELARVWTKIDQIRAKQAAKPKHSPLPGSTPKPNPK